MDKLLVILGCTASGKGSLGRELARRLGGRVVSVDSMKVYRRMDIGTAKPSTSALAEIPHYCVDVVEPSEAYSVARFVEDAEAGIAETRAAGCVPLAVGGTSLYLKALTEGLFEGPSAVPELRNELSERIEAEGAPALHAELARVDPDAASRIHPNDAKRIIRGLEVYRTTGVPISEHQRQWEAGRTRHECRLIGLRRDRDDQARRINARAKRMVQAGLRDEVAALLDEPAGLSDQAAQAVGYAEMIDHLQGRCTLEEALERIKINTRRLAKKQRTWHRRFAGVEWIDLAVDDTVAAVADRVLEGTGRP